MYRTSEAEVAGPSFDYKHFSCLVCRQRKVRCDRHHPCLNCTKSGRRCSFIPPVRGKPKRRKAPKEGLHAKLKRYEEMLKSYGATVEPSDACNELSDVEPSPEPDVHMTEIREPQTMTSGEPLSADETRTRLVSKNGSSRYFENDLWSNLGDVDDSDFQDPKGENDPVAVGNSDIEPPHRGAQSLGENALVLCTCPLAENFSSLHYPLHIVQKLLNIYVDRVDPTMKLLHLPTFRSMLTTALKNPKRMTKDLEACIFAFYSITIVSLGDSECYDLLGEQKIIVSSRYKVAARQALTNANFMSTSSLSTLQSYVIFLMVMRGHYQADSMFILSGIAVRIARRMGIHRDGSNLGLLPFETEMRRRLWWHIVHFDCRTSDLAGTKPSMDLFLGDSKMPLNVEDEDLELEMADPPKERTGITSIVLCLIRCDIIEFLRLIGSPQKLSNDRWDNLSSPCITLAEKDSFINQMEDRMEMKYLRYSDPSNTLHLFSSILVRSSICKMKLFAHNPRQFATDGLKVPQTSRDIIFVNGMKFLEYSILVKNNESLRKFTSQLSITYLWDPLLYVLIEARYRKIGTEVSHAWQLISEVFDNYPRIWEETTDMLHHVLGKMILKVWNECVVEWKATVLSELATPEFITIIRRYLAPTKISSSTNELNTTTSTIVNLPNQKEAGNLSYDGDSILNFGSMDSYDFSKLLSFDLEPDDWIQWDRLLAEYNA